MYSVRDNSSGMNKYCLHPGVLITIFIFHLGIKGQAIRTNTHNLHPVLSKLQPNRPFIILTVSLEGINCTFMTAQAISKVLSAKISYYTVSAPIRISSLPGHDVPLDDMWLAKIDPAGILVVLQAFVCEVQRDVGVADSLYTLPCCYLALQIKFNWDSISATSSPGGDQSLQWKYHPRLLRWLVY